MITQSLKSSGSEFRRHDVRDEAARLKAEILQRGDELARLERLAGSVSSSRQASKVDLRSVVAGPPSPSTARSASTGKIIEQLQKEIDHLKLSSQAASQSFESERRAREALKIKYDDLEITLTNLRLQTKSHSASLQRSDHALLAARGTTQELQSSLALIEESKQTLERNYGEKEKALETLENQLASETSRRQQVEQEYQILATNFTQMQEVTRSQVKELRSGLSTTKTAVLADTVQLRTAKENIILFNERQAEVMDQLDHCKQEILDDRTRQIATVKSSMDRLTDDVARCLMLHAQDEAGIDALKTQLRTAIESAGWIKLGTKD